jgi:hypothetical protein
MLTSNENCQNGNNSTAQASPAGESNFRGFRAISADETEQLNHILAQAPPINCLRILFKKNRVIIVGFLPKYRRIVVGKKPTFAQACADLQDNIMYKLSLPALVYQKKV